jgi:hypothetical protein
MFKQLDFGQVFRGLIAARGIFDFRRTFFNPNEPNARAASFMRYAILATVSASDRLAISERRLTSAENSAGVGISSTEAMLLFGSGNSGKGMASPRLRKVLLSMSER